ncbi:hypothetical protein CBR_g44586 [Chara braunii]|uniref:Integrase catalytic domain-containing protein n=1 Tax=Chara braunii TaxID=69332 RepID=A0A388LXS4_CHABU|nr:hypothetical protein CBR_g44586 [Chara braunii]|eukprot:GBG87130.1 hypothetical protein CBR_g44586 [Chara braunii]
MATTAMSTSAQQTSQAGSSGVVGSTVAQTVSQSTGLVASQAAVLTPEDVAIQQAALQEAQLQRALGEIKAEKEKMIRRRARMQRRGADIVELETMDLTNMDDDVRVLLTSYLRCFSQPLRNQLAKEANINMHNFPSFSKVALDLEAKIGHGQAPTTDGRKKTLPPNWKAKGRLMFVDNDGSTIELDGNLQEGVGCLDALEGGVVAAVAQKGKATSRRRGGSRSRSQVDPNAPPWEKAGLTEDVWRDRYSRQACIRYGQYGHNQFKCRNKKTVEEHVAHLDKVLGLLRQHKCKINSEKCEFGRTRVLYLGHEISAEGLKPDDAKVANIRDWPRPQSVTEMRSFLGMTGYYRTFVKNYSIVAAPLTDLTRLDTPWKWTDKCEAACRHLKHALTHYEVLKLPDPDKPFIVTTDASQYGIGTVLAQQEGPKLRLVDCTWRLVIVDRFSKYARLVAMPETAKTEYVIRMFKENWVRDFGLPKSIVSDRDVRFTSELRKAAAAEQGTRLQMTYGNHPEVNGQAEQLNRVVQHLLRHYIKPNQVDWDEKLALIASLYSNVIHNATGVSPNSLLPTFKPRLPLDFLLPENESTAAPGTLEFAYRYEQKMQQAVEPMQKAQAAMIESENRHRRPSTFQIGDRVWVKSSELGQEYGISRKLMPRYFGPWEVLDIVGTDPDGPSYVIRIPGHLRTHPVFHTSKLAPFKETEQFPSRRSMLPPTMDEEVDIDDIVDHRELPVSRPEGRGRPPKPKLQYRVRFRHHTDPKEDRWFTREELMQTAPQVVTQYERSMQKGKRPMIED